MKTNFRLSIILIVTVTPLLLFANARGVTCTYESGDVPKDIPSESTISSSLTIPDSVTIEDVDVVVNITHTWDADLDAYLIAPDGTQVELFSDVGINGNDFIETQLDDEAAGSIAAGAATFTGSFKPEGMLSALDGKNAKGDWTLKIKDDSNFDSGALLSWRLIVDIGPLPGVPSNPSPVNAEVDVAVDACLSWDADPDSADTIWDVYMSDPNGVLQMVASDLTEPSFCPGGLSFETLSSWQVVAKKACHETPGPIWVFRTTSHPKVIWVSFHGADDMPSDGAAGAGFTEAPDKGYTDLLTANGYNVTRYITTGTPDPEVLNAADLVIISRSVASGGYSGDGATAWNSISAPMIIMQGWAIRSSRMGYTTGTTMEDITGDVTLTVTDPNHPIFAGIPLTDGTMDNPFAGIVVYPTDGTTVTRGLSVNTNEVNAEGTVLATISEAGNGPVGGMVIGEWQAGAVLTHSGGAETDVLAGNRLVFLTGSREAEGISSETAGIYDLLLDGEQMLLNAAAYMLAAVPVDPGTENIVHSYTFEDGTANDSVGDADGVLVGGAEIIDGSLVTTAQDQWMEMPGDVIDMNSFDEVTIEAWYTPEAGANTGWSMLAYFGNSVDGFGSNGYFMTSARGDDKSRAAISCGDEATPWASESGADGPEYDDGLLHHMVSTINATDITLYIDGVLIASTPLSETNSISCISPNFAYLAKGGYEGDPEWIGQIHEFNIYNRALTEGEVMYLAGIRPEPIMLDVENFSFELPGTGKQKCWDGENLNTETPDDPNDYFTDVPGWSSDTAAMDSGEEGPDAWPGNTEGVWAGYMMGTDPSTFNLLNYDIKAGDNYVLYVDARNNWTADAALPALLEMTLYYEADGVRVPVASQAVELTTEWATFVLEFSADDVPESIGNMLGIELNNVSNATTDNNSWIGMDNVRVSVSPN